MKLATLLLMTLFSVSAQAQMGDQRFTVVKCTGGTGAHATTLLIEVGGIAGLTTARISHGSFSSGDLYVEQFMGPSIPENITYVDAKTKGKDFSLSFDFLNPGMRAELVYRDASKKVPALPPLTCFRTR